MTGALLPHPLLTRIYRLEATAELSGGAFSGRTLNGRLVPGASIDRETVLPDGSTLCDVTYTLQTHEGDLIRVRARGIDTGAESFRTSTQIETDAPRLDWLNAGVFVSVARLRDDAVIHETYLVD